MIEISKPETFEKEPLVSVLMLAYKHEAYIAQAIEGVLAQKCSFPFEIIVAEDCSPDATRAVAESYLERHPSVIRIITGHSNIGARPNSLRAQTRCRGKYIAFCECDDYWCDSLKLEKQVAILESDERIGMVHGNFVNTHLCHGKWEADSVGVHDKRTPSDLRGELFALVLRELVARTCTVCYRKSVLDALRRSPLSNPTFMAGDLPTAVFCTANWRVGYVEDVVSVYRLSPGSSTRGNFAAKVRFSKSVLKIHQVIEEMYGHRTDYDAASHKKACQSLARAAFRAQDRDAFRQALQSLARIDPRSANSIGLQARRLLLEAQPFGQLANCSIDLGRMLQYKLKQAIGGRKA